MPKTNNDTTPLANETAAPAFFNKTRALPPLFWKIITKTLAFSGTVILGIPYYALATVGAILLSLTDWQLAIMFIAIPVVQLLMAGLVFLKLCGRSVANDRLGGYLPILEYLPTFKDLFNLLDKGLTKLFKTRFVRLVFLLSIGLAIATGLLVAFPPLGLAALIGAGGKLASFLHLSHLSTPVFATVMSIGAALQVISIAQLGKTVKKIWIDTKAKIMAAQQPTETHTDPHDQISAPESSSHRINSALATPTAHDLTSPVSESLPVLDDNANRVTTQPEEPAESHVVSPVKPILHSNDTSSTSHQLQPPVPQQDDEPSLSGQKLDNKDDHESATQGVAPLKK